MASVIRGTTRGVRRPGHPWVNRGIRHPWHRLHPSSVASSALVIRGIVCIRHPWQRLHSSSVAPSASVIRGIVCTRHPWHRLHPSSVASSALVIRGILGIRHPWHHPWYRPFSSPVAPPVIPSAFVLRRSGGGHPGCFTPSRRARSVRSPRWARSRMGTARLSSPVGRWLPRSGRSAFGGRRRRGVRSGGPIRALDRASQGACSHSRPRRRSH